MSSTPRIKSLPSPKQVWSHSTCSVQSLTNALEDSSITAIETDILMGTVVNKDGDEYEEQSRLIPVMAHPPDRKSDLSVKTFLSLSTKLAYDTKDAPGVAVQKRELKKIVKLDFKDLEAVKPTLKEIKDLGISSNGKVIFLNADVFPGPGLQSGTPVIDGDVFLKTCLTGMDFHCETTGVLAMEREPIFAFSLGWRVDCHALRGYTSSEVLKMAQLITRHNVLSLSTGIVLAVNARVLSKNCAPFDTFLSEFPTAQLLAWTGTGEPPISQHKVSSIKQHFAAAGTLDRVGYDCNMSDAR